MDEYAEAKANIFRHQRPNDIAVFNYDNPWTRRFGEEAPGQVWFTSLERGGTFERGSTQIDPFIFTDTPLAGRHNLENILLATTTARILGVPDEIIASTVRHFASVAHRLADVRQLKDVRYINDSSSTTPIAGQVALEAFHDPIILIAGGNTKHLPLAQWPQRIIQHCRHVILLSGSGTDELQAAIQQEAAQQNRENPICGIFDDYRQALDTANQLAQSGDIVLLSPGFTSFGMFLNEFDRGDKFVAYVQAL
jgi:UDP-N-acetylmuramoylalanine--D-glutamate ligase